MSERMDVQKELQKIEERMEQGMKEMQSRLMEQKKVADEFVKEKPYMAMGMVFIAGLTLGCMAALIGRSKD